MKYLLVLFFSFLIFFSTAQVASASISGVCSMCVPFESNLSLWGKCMNNQPCKDEKAKVAAEPAPPAAEPAPPAAEPAPPAAEPAPPAAEPAPPAAEPAVVEPTVSSGGFKDIGAKLGNVSKGFYGDVVPKSLEQMIGGYIKTGLALVGVIFLMLMVYGGYTWMLARGDETEAKKAKDTITMAAIGMAVVLIAYVITYFILSYALQSVG